MKIAKVKADKKRLDAYTKISLPFTPNTQPTASLERRMEVANREYVGKLTEMLTKSGFAAGTFTIVPKPPDNKSGPPLAKNKPVYTRLDFTVDVKGDLASLVDFLERFYTLRVLHQIKNFTFTRPMSGKGNELDVKLVIEALVLDTAEQRATLEPATPVDLPPVLVPGREYARIAGKDIFFGPAPPVREQPVEVVKFNDPSPYLKLVGLTVNQDGPVATLFDVYTNQDFEVTPRSAGDGFRVQVFYTLNGRKRELRSGKAIELVDEAGDPQITYSVVKFAYSPNGLVLRCAKHGRQPGRVGKYYFLRAGQTLEEMTPLTNKEEFARFGVKPDLKPTDKPGDAVAETGKDRLKKPDGEDQD